jgi:hypothetical protein
MLLATIGKARVRHLFGRCLNLHLHFLLVRSRILAFALNNLATLMRFRLLLSWRNLGFYEIFITAKRIILLFLLIKFVILLLLLLLKLSLLLDQVLGYRFGLSFLNIESRCYIGRGLWLLLEVMLL